VEKGVGAELLDVGGVLHGGDSSGRLRRRLFRKFRSLQHSLAALLIIVTTDSVSSNFMKK
jgi:hypothetical protein